MKLSLTDQLFSVIHVANVDFAVAYKLGSGDDYLFSGDDLLMITYFQTVSFKQRDKSVDRFWVIITKQKLVIE